ncbi:MAG: hypothetical protein WCG25_07715 [bacterium]
MFEEIDDTCTQKRILFGSQMKPATKKIGRLGIDPGFYFGEKEIEHKQIYSSQKHH